MGRLSLAAAAAAHGITDADDIQVF